MSGKTRSEPEKILCSCGIKNMKTHIRGVNCPQSRELNMSFKVRVEINDGDYRIGDPLVLINSDFGASISLWTEEAELLISELQAALYQISQNDVF